MSFTDRFTNHAGAYAAGRPSYPPASIDAILAGFGDPSNLAVADLGAGTGISSRLFADRGAHVFAIEPNAAMRSAAEPDARIEWVDGTAESTTLADRSVDIVGAFQAWHWFDPTVATAEARRIVRPGGILAVVYNERDERDYFTLGYGDVVRRYSTDATEQRRAKALAHALGIDPAKTKREHFPNEQTLDRAALHERATSSSYLPRSGEAAKRMHAALDDLFGKFAVREAVVMHLVTIVVRVELSNDEQSR
jgi:SAM-dependent methyltransferase